jgi:hypothetical protein
VALLAFLGFCTIFEAKRSPKKASTAICCPLFGSRNQNKGTQSVGSSDETMYSCTMVKMCSGTTAEQLPTSPSPGANHDPGSELLAIGSGSVHWLLSRPDKGEDKYGAARGCWLQ